MTMIATRTEEHTFETPNGNGVRFLVRPETSDWNTCNSITEVGDEYTIPTGLSGWAIDLGAHIGAATCAVLIDNPDLQVVAIEALPENVAMTEANLALNGLTDRAVVLNRAGGDGTDVWIGYGEVRDPTRIHEFIGNMNAPEGSRGITVRGISLVDAIAEAHGSEIVWLKTDSEGAEWKFLDSPDIWRVKTIIGEWHDGGGYPAMEALLSPTHDVYKVSGEGGLGLFRAERR